jgi:hypothetical protein
VALGAGATLRQAARGQQTERDRAEGSAPAVRIIGDASTRQMQGGGGDQIVDQDNGSRTVWWQKAPGYLCVARAPVAHPRLFWSEEIAEFLVKNRDFVDSRLDIVSGEIFDAPWFRGHARATMKFQ